MTKKHTFSKKRLTIYHCVLPLFLGGLIYVLFRSSDLRLFKLFGLLGIDDGVYNARIIFLEFKVWLPEWLYYSLPDGLWVYSFTSVLLIIWNNEIEKVKYLLLIPFFSGVLIEVFQALKLFEGTFDFLDLVFSIGGFLLSIFTINYQFKKNEKSIY